MKLTELKSIVKTAVREAIQEELKDILLEAVKTPKQVVQEYRPVTQPIAKQTQTHQPLPETDRVAMRENIQNVLGNMMPGANGTLNATSANVPLQVTSGDTTSPNGQLPAGEVSTDQIMNLMQGKV
jgi:hypothetical protein